MAFDVNNEQDVAAAIADIKRRCGDFFGSAEYSKAVTRWIRRRDAFYCRPPVDAPVWRSRLYLPTYFLGATALMAQFRAGRKGDDWLQVSRSDDSDANPEVKELAELAQKDMRYDLAASDFESEQSKLEWYVALFGTACAREFIRIHDKTDHVPMPGGGTHQIGGIEEITGTQVIHPLNFGHELDKSDFKKSDWGAVRFLLHVSEIFKMRDNPDYYQPGVEKLIEGIQKRTVMAAQDSAFYYSDTPISQDKAQRYVAVCEYSGPLWHLGNEGDTGLYYALYVPGSDTPLRIGANPFGRHPFWKESSWCDPTSPWGVGPNDFLLPINAWENSTVNQYVDYANSSLKFLWKVNPKAVEGGVRTLATSLPNGMIPVANNGEGLWNEMIEPIRSTQGGLPPISDVIGMINKYKEEVGPSSNLRGKSSNQLTDTATGISLMAEREDQAVDAIMSGIDKGIADGMMIKWSNRTKFFTNQRTDSNKKGELISYYPYELAALGHGVTFKVRRNLADTEAGKKMNFIRMLTALDGLMQARGTPLPMELLIDSYRDLGRALGVEDIDERFESINKMLQAPPAPPPGTMAPHPGGIAGADPLAAAPVDMPLPVGQQDVGAGVTPIGEMGNALAMA